MLTLHELLFTLGWDTRCRNLDVARILKPLLLRNPILLDAGCGEYGLARFVRPATVIGIDINEEVNRSSNFMFLRGSITSLPFSDQSFPIAASVDTLEHLPPTARDQAIVELVRVAQRAVVIAFPCGQKARQVDEDFRNRLVRLNRNEPAWLTEHLQNSYPHIESVLATIKREALKYHTSVCADTYYSEHIEMARLLRWAASYSSLLYIGINLIAGLLSPIFPTTKREFSYRVVILSRFQ